jgi:hypothetical protein
MGAAGEGVVGLSVGQAIVEAKSLVSGGINTSSSDRGHMPPSGHRGNLTRFYK